jgi:hypothetical protein
MDVKKLYQIKISESFAAFGNFSSWEDIIRTQENIKENIKQMEAA